MKPYPEYKDSVVKPIGKIPSGWVITKIKFCSIIINGYAFSSDSYIEDGVPIIRIGDIKPNIDLEQTKKVPKEFLKSHSVFQIYVGDILLALTGATIGKTTSFHIREPALLNQRVAIIRAKKDTVNGFLKHVISSQLFKNHIDYECVGGAQDNIGKPEIGGFRLVFPSMGEQEAIAHYLDHKTRLIDTLIEKKQKQIELFKEQRAAIINHAITKGLNPNAKMKDSGIEWLGEVPEHWEIKKTKYIFRLSVDKAPENNNHELLSIYTDIGVRPRKDLEARGNKASTTDGYLLVKKGDIIVNKLLAWMGAIGYSKYDGVTSPAYDILRKIRPANSRYYHYLFRGGLYLTEFRRRSRGIMDMRLRLYFDEFGQILLPYPPEDEQNLIVEYIDAKIDNLKSLIDKQVSGINLLTEYRTSLISDVVTGKIDVRDEVIQ